ncbi:tetratricopeptide repeat protein [Microbacterium sp. AK031]|uniref:tetratricopeptide repeat protein n=1 Tax=Microbacterium sp. AK031 TaxID=2723076 RepID=UPI002167389F|nr:tetratricopeptide repeat protein [Microbacterium sp. AK031]MCS3843070.1 hypothetical protein [Microbacterium sp. AK031]
MTGWWRRNTLPRIALAVLAPVTAGVIGWNEWQEYFLHRSTTQVAPETEDGTVELGGATWGPIRSQYLGDVEGLTVPEGAEVVVAVIPVTPGAEPISCPAPTLIEQSSGREWSEGRLDLGLSSSSAEPTTCDSTVTEPYELLMPYIVPKDAEGPFWVNIAPPAESPKIVQFSIDP